MNIHNENLIRWLAGGERGISSNTIVEYLTGLPALRDSHSCHPFDPSDLWRCRKLLEQVPELVPEFPRMAAVSPEWAALVSHWDGLCALMDEEAQNWPRGKSSARRTYEWMKRILKEARQE